MFYSILLFYLLSILVIGLNGDPLPDCLNLDVFLILNRSSMGLSESLKREHDDIALHDRFQTIWI